MSCIKISKTNKAESNLFNTIYNGVANKNEQLATFYYNWFNTKAFDKLFGFNYIEEYKKGLENGISESITEERVDENGEPKLFYNEDNKTYYFLDKDNQKIYFPLANKGLSQLWTQEQIKNVVSRLTASYIKRNTNINFNNIDFSGLINLPNIEKFITYEINNKISELENSDEFGKALMLEEALGHIDELHDLVIQKFKDMAIDVEQDVVHDNEDEEDTRENQNAWGKASFERSSKSKVSTNIKLRLSLLSDPTKTDEIWNESVLMDFDVIYSKLQDILCNNMPAEGEYLFETYLNKIEDLSNHFPYLKDLHQMLLVNKDENFRNEFVQAFYLAKNTFVNEKYTANENGITQNTIDLTNSIDKLTIVKNLWQNNFNALYTENGEVTVEKANNFSPFFTMFKEQVTKASVTKKENKSNEQVINSYKNLVMKALTNLGVTISEEAFNYYLNDAKGEELFNNINKLANQLNNYVIPNITKSNFNLFTSTDEINKLVRAQAFINNDMSDPNLRIAGNKRWLFSNPSHLHMQLERWKKNPEILLKEYKENPYTQGSKWIKEWFELDTEMTDEERIKVAKIKLDKVKLGVLGEITFTKNGKDEFKETTELSYKDYFLNNINSVLKSNGFVRTITQADKSTEFVFKTLIDRIKGFVGYNSANGNYSLTDEVKNLYFNYYVSEIKRMITARQDVLNAEKDKVKLTPHYHYDYKKSLKDLSSIHKFTGNAFKSQYFNFLNPGKAKTETEKDIVNLLYEDGIFKLDNLNDQTLEQLEVLFFNYFEKSITPQINDTINEMLNLGIIEVKDGKYINKLLDTNLINSYTESQTPNGIHTAIYKIASDYLLNGISNNIEFNKLFTGDVAYYKDSVDFKKRIPATYTDGKYLVLKPGEADFRIATINAVNINSPFLDLLKEEQVDDETLNMLTNVNSTDAQAWITPERWKFLKEKLGQWSNVHESVYNKMQSTTPQTYTKEELKAAAQPVKGVYFYKLNGKPTYLKYSQAVLSKSLVKGTELEKLVQSMYDNKIDELITFDGVKVGAIEPTTIHNKNGTIVDNPKFNVQTLNNHGWKLQQDLPTKNFKDTDVGSQIQKNIFAGLKHYMENNNFTYKGKRITGKELNDALVDTVGKLSDIGYDKLLSKSGIDKNGNITNQRKFYKALIDELKSRGGSENVVKALEAETVLLGIPQTTGKLFEIFASIINKNIIKIKTNGGSFIQMADFGLSHHNLDSKNSIIKINPNIEGLNPPLIRTNEDGSKSVTPGSVFIPSSFIAKYIPNWKDYSAEELFISYNGGDPIIDKRIQENIIGYRIPNQGLPSNDSLQIAGILPESAGDTIVAYTGITSKTGSDFDIDKMYIMFPQYKSNENRLEYSIEGPEGIQNDLIEIYKSVLTNPEVYSDVMKSIDNDFVKDEINHLKPEKNDNFMAAMDPKDDIKLRYSFLGGKAGVGMEANAMTDIWRSGELTVHNLFNFNWGNIKDGIVNLDEEYSETLSDEDMEYYANEMGKTEDEKSNLTSLLKKIKIGETLGTILNAFVDIAKDPYISKGNWTTSTTNVGNLMLRMGVHPLYVINFLANPIISDYIEFQQNNEGLFDNNSGDTFNKFKNYIIQKKLGEINSVYSTLYNTYFNDLNVDYIIEKIDNEQKKTELITKKENAKKSIIEKHGEEVYQDFLEKSMDFHKQVFFPESLNLYDRKTNQYNKYKLNLEYFRKQASGKETNLNFQITLLNEFRNLQQSSKFLKQIVDFGKLDVNGVGKDPNNIFNLEELYQNIQSDSITEKDEDGKDIKGLIKGFETKLDDTILSKYYNNLLKIKDILHNNPGIFPLSSTKVRSLFSEMINDMKKSYSAKEDTYDKLSRQFKTYIYNKIFDISNEEREKLNDLGYEVDTFRKANPGKYFILENLNNVLGTLQLGNSDRSLEYQRLFTESWEELFEDNPELATKLVHYSFIETGFNMTRSQFYSYIPYQFFIRLNINGKINEIFRDDEFIEFKDKFYLNNLTDTKIVKKYKSIEGSIEKYLGKEGSNGLVLYVNKHKHTSNPYIEFENKYFKYMGVNSNGNHVYVQIKNEPVTNNYNVELELYEFNNDILAKQSIEIEDTIEDKIEKNIINKENIPSILPNMSKIISNLEEMFNNGLMLDKFNESGINNIEDLNNKSEDELAELLKKICK